KTKKNRPAPGAPIVGAISASALALLLGFGCSSGHGSDQGPSTGAFLENLTTDLGVCSQARTTCLDAADGDRPKIQTCEDERAACGQAVQAAFKEVHDGIRACASAARQCLQSSADGGPSARKQCGQ